MCNMRGPDNCQIELDMMRIYLYGAIEKASLAAKEAIYAFAEGDEQRMMLMGLKRFTKLEPFNLKETRRRVADHILDKQDYTF